MAAHASQSTLYLTLPETADFAADIDLQTQSLRAGQTGPGSISLTGGEDVFAYLVYSGTSSTEGIFIPKKDLVIREFTAAASADYDMRTPVSGNATLYCGGCPAPAFTMRKCNGCIIKNNNDAVIYIRRGTPNEFGIPIGKPGDSNADNVQGIAIPASGSYSIESYAIVDGESWYLLGSAAAQTATVMFQ